MPPCVRPFLVVARTTLVDPSTGTRYPFNGLFAGQDLPKGAFLGFYHGTFKDGVYEGRRDAYVFATSDMHIVPKRRSKGVSAYEHPLAMCNEPPRGGAANVSSHEFTTAKHVIPHLKASTKIAALGFHTCTCVRAGEELFLHYGREYDRSHYKRLYSAERDDDTVGDPGRLRVGERELPERMMQTFGLYSFVLDDCYALYSL